MEKWSDWKSSFSKTNGNFSASPVFGRVLTKGRNAKIFPWNTHLKEKDFDTDLDEKKWSVFFMDKKVATSMNSNTVCAFLNVKIPKCYVPADRFSNKLCLFLSRRNYRRKNWRSWKKFNYWPLSSENLTDLWFQLSRKIENTQPRWQPTYVKHKS